MSSHNCNVIFCDIEANIKTKRIEEIGIVYQNKELKTSSILESIGFVKLCDSNYIAGHNFIDFDIEILKKTSMYEYIKNYNIIDTLPLSLLLFNEKTVHSLPKNYKSEDNFKNNPVEDSKITLKLFIKLEEKFISLDKNTQTIIYSLLKDNIYFKAFFKYIQGKVNLLFLNQSQLQDLIKKVHQTIIVNYNYLIQVIEKNPVELAYILALLTPHIEIKSHPPKVLFAYPDIVKIQRKLCFDIDHANDKLVEFSKEVFGFGDFRLFPRLNAGIFDNPTLSQREIVEASLRDESFLAVLPTGGGKTFTFWLPALYKAKSYKALTVVISPLQALIEDHITNFNKSVANFKAVAISGFLSPLERSDAIEQVINGEADILYIAPESLRSNMIFRILKNRLIERFVIDEAHCLSTWGNDFRQDYYYICEYIQDLLKEKPFQTHIPISCFTATAKPTVIQDIETYFFNGLNIKLDKYLAIPERENLKYKSIPSDSKSKYKELLKLIHEHDGSTLVYIPSSTKKCDEIANQLSLDTAKNVRSFHSKIESEEKMKILKDYIDDKINIIVATTAFGMGVDKANITQVIHYEISDSLESYAQEAGRGARNKDLTAFCPILFDENDLDKHFIALNRSKLTASEINSIFKVIKREKSNIINKTAFEFAKEAGWDVEDNGLDYSTKIKTALLELEREGYISRKRNKINFYADSIIAESMVHLHEKLKSSAYDEREQQKLVLVLQSILGRGKVSSIQIDELAYLLGYKKDDISLAIHELKEMNILGDSKDLSLQISHKSIKKFTNIREIENFLFSYLLEYTHPNILIRELNDYLFTHEVIKTNQVDLIKAIIQNWRDKSGFLFKRINREQDLWHFEFLDSAKIQKTITLRHILAEKILEFFASEIKSTDKEKIEFSLKILRDIVDQDVAIKEIDRTLLYLHQLDILKLLQGRFINYSPMTLYVEEKTTQKNKYTEYKNRMESHYITKIESIHIMGEYAKRLKEDNYQAALFLKDYFTLEYNSFKKKYNLLKAKISKPITQTRFNKIFEKMSDEQKEIIEDTNTNAMMILAGPGSGKTKVLVHKIASLILTEDIKPEQFMMLTFSKTAKWEFKSRLNQLIGALSYDVEIQTFHSFALKLIARVIKEENRDILNQVIEEATRAINNAEVKSPYITVLVLDEFQDINEKSFEFVKAIYNAHNQDLKIIAVGDDDQCIMGHAGANVEFIDKFEKEFDQDDEGKSSYKKYELLCNFRSNKNIVEYSNNFVSTLTKRYKKYPLYANTSEPGGVRVYTYSNSLDLVLPVIELIKREERLSNIAILAYTNEEVMQIYSLLQENNINAKYLIEREKFELKQIEELYEFNKILNSFLEDENTYKESYFEKSLEIIQQKYAQSPHLELLNKVIDRFMSESDDYFITEWISYLDELKLENFEDYKKHIVVSTIHKSKGMEFDKVFLLVNTNPTDDEQKRLYYVGMTRAKSELNILRKGNDYTDKKDYAKYILDENRYIQNEKTYMHVMSLADIYLGFDIDKYARNSSLIAGLKVDINKRENSDYYNIIYHNTSFGSFSNKFKMILEKKISQGYTIDSVIVDCVVLWFNQELKKFVRYPLCKVILKK